MTDIVCEARYGYPSHSICKAPDGAKVLIICPSTTKPHFSASVGSSYGVRELPILECEATQKRGQLLDGYLVVSLMAVVAIGYVVRATSR